MPGTTGAISNCMIGFPNRIDDATLSGGSYETAFPRDNLKVRDQGDIAQTTDLLATSTLFNMDLGTLVAARLFAIANHNFSPTAKYRLRASVVEDFSTLRYDSGWLDVWPVVYPFGSLPWEDPRWWGGRYLDEDIEGYNRTLVHVLPENTVAIYWRFEVLDEANSEGCIKMGRPFIGPAWQPHINMSWGQSLGWESKTEVMEMLSGAESFRVRTPYRVDRFRLDALTREEAMANVFEIQRRAGLDKELLWVNNPSDTSDALRTRFLARLRVLSPIEYPYNSTNSVSFELKELL